MSALARPKNERESDSSCTWQPVYIHAAQPGWPKAIVHLWQAFFPAWETETARLARHLSLEERERMQRFCDSDLAARYAIGRGLLRELLGKYLNIAPGEVQISVNKHGKPKLAGSGAKFLHFNTAHTEEVVLYGFTGLASIGVDVESVASGSPEPAEARRIFSDEEWAAWQTLPEAEQNLLFYQTWVRKEAILKAMGVGLAIEPDTFAVNFTGGSVVQIAGKKFCICDLRLNASVKAAVALTDVDMPQICCFTIVSA